MYIYKSVCSHYTYMCISFSLLLFFKRWNKSSFLKKKKKKEEEFSLFLFQTSHASYMTHQTGISRSVAKIKLFSIIIRNSYIKRCKWLWQTLTSFATQVKWLVFLLILERFWLFFTSLETKFNKIFNIWFW